MKMLKQVFYISYLFCVILSVPVLSAQPPRQMIQVQIIPQKQTFEYRLGENVVFQVAVTLSGLPADAVSATYAISEDMMEAHSNGVLTLTNGKATVDAGTMRKPGFLRCRVNVVYGGVDYEGACTVGFAPDNLLPTVEMPDDFEAFWAAQLAEANQIPMNPRLEPIDALSDEQVETYHLSLGAFRQGVKVYGILCVPRKEGRYPVILKLPGAGIRPYSGDTNTARNGFITLELGIHGIPVNQPQEVYEALAQGALNGYPAININSREDFYYRRVYLSCSRAVDYLAQHPKADNRNIFVAGGSQGGALAIVTAALNPHVKAIMALYPALCDMTAYLHGRAGGWPHYFRNRENTPLLQAEAIVASYYDVANFARLLDAPCYMSFGFNDETCPPTAVYSAYNVIHSEKKLFLVEETGHYNYPEQWNIGWDWMMSFYDR